MSKDAENRDGLKPLPEAQAESEVENYPLNAEIRLVLLAGVFLAGNFLVTHRENLWQFNIALVLTLVLNIAVINICKRYRVMPVAILACDLMLIVLLCYFTGGAESQIKYLGLPYFYMNVSRFGDKFKKIENGLKEKASRLVEEGEPVALYHRRHIGAVEKGYLDTCWCCHYRLGVFPASKSDCLALCRVAGIPVTIEADGYRTGCPERDRPAPREGIGASQTQDHDRLTSGRKAGNYFSEH